MIKIETTIWLIILFGLISVGYAYLIAYQTNLVENPALQLKLFFLLLVPFLSVSSIYAIYTIHWRRQG